MQKLQMEKIEELTLYIIQQNNKINTLVREMEIVKKNYNDLK